MHENWLVDIQKSEQVALANTLEDCNTYSAQFGLVLTEQQMLTLWNERKVVLKNAGRIEFGKPVFEKLVLAFASSPYIDKKNYESTLSALQEIFYNFKTEARELITDDELIEKMRYCFNEVCHGVIEYLSETILTEWVRERRMDNMGFCE